MQLTEKDLKQLEAHGLTNEEIQRQINILKKGLPYTKVLAPATPGNGIIQLTKQQADALKTLFETKQNNLKIEKFVPASGAATRMFKDWVFFHQNYQPGRDYYERFVKKHQLHSFPAELTDFLEHFAGYAFYQDLMDVIKRQEPGYFQLDENEQAWKLLHYVLTADGLGYQKLPKALLKFHRYNKDDIRTAMEEQLVEGKAYTHEQEAQGKVHFSISPQHAQAFSDLARQLQEKYPVLIEHSFQKPQTDTIMLDENGALVRDTYGNLVFRPGGHGSLLDNIQDLDADIIFLKNIDNVQKGAAQNTSINYKKILGGYLLQLKEQASQYLQKLRDEKPIHEELKEIEDFARNTFNIHFIEGYDTLNNSGKRKYLAYKINRPIRVAGMVKNTGEPGGGPFWAADQNGLKSLQIVEKAQIDPKNTEQQEILNQSTHFNPVDLVVSTKDFEGNKFNLKEFVNEQAAFITEKSYQGKPVKVYERPGLWNGAMDNWNTVFIEVPLETFSPVKTVTDLLKPEHQ